MGNWNSKKLVVTLYGVTLVAALIALGVDVSPEQLGALTTMVAMHNVAQAAVDRRKGDSKEVSQ